MFVVSFNLGDTVYKKENINLKGFNKLLKSNKNLKRSLLMPFFSGLTHSSGVMGLIITLSKIDNFKTNLNLGTVDSICAILSLLVCVIYSFKIKKENLKKILYLSGTISLIVLCLFAFKPTLLVLIVYLFVRNSFVTFMSLVAGTTGANLSNIKDVKTKFKPEYVFARDLMYAIARCSGYLILLIVCVLFGKEFINYILILSGFALLLESIVTAKMQDYI